MNYYKTFTGERISKQEIDKRINEAKKLKISHQFDEYGYNFCQIKGKKGCSPDSNCGILDCSHIESVDSCQKNGYCEKTWDINNIQIIGRKCHRIHDKTNLKFKENE
jgi:hypothetical protein